ncbi:MAG: hypothetical protein GXO32_03300 [Crenarchaeota archaeon]|nr:hypothetical protein [Thermoproteota archaeon]
MPRWLEVARYLRIVTIATLITTLIFAAVTVPEILCFPPRFASLDVRNASVASLLIIDGYPATEIRANGTIYAPVAGELKVPSGFTVTRIVGEVRCSDSMCKGYGVVVLKGAGTISAESWMRANVSGRIVAKLAPLPTDLVMDAVIVTMIGLAAVSITCLLLSLVDLWKRIRSVCARRYKELEREPGISEEELEAIFKEYEQ